ncbi:probable disease resistance protein At4g27220 [Neltuma alba]|uniref:probable disease resistance protein At4g27220 n=1 Tax=Neltuma alba TaxID=207710 RepID=UPI0010A587AA|nr:probable disease resistance protein At4g27220 [Prosopis alba]
MAEIAGSVIAKLVEYSVAPLVRQGQYLFCAGNITKTLETEKQELASRQDGIQARVQEALNRTDKILDAVDKWLGEVRSHMDEVQKLEQQMKESNSCFQGRCPTWRRYRFCRQMTKMIEATKNLNQRSKFDSVSIPVPIPDVEYFDSKNFEYFQSTRLAFDQLMAALRDSGVRMIGLYGMGGSGKTTLVTEVGKEAKKSNLFDLVIFTTVSQTPNIRKIQDEIADMFNLKLDEQSEAGRARRLSMRLSNRERILIIFDDVWAGIHLKDVGIPLEDYRGCKILLTTRRQQVCSLMDCERKIPLHLLSDEESWTLFQKHARNVDESLSNVAQGIVRECKGLPIAIQAVGASLKGKSVAEWKQALNRLRKSKPIDVEEGVRDAFPCLQLSYDYLRSNEAKSLFLTCCMYPEDANILIEDLFRIMIGLDMCEELNSLEEARNKVGACVNILVDSCLLMRSEKYKGRLRMHDVVRDVALWISRQENRNIVVNLEKDMKMATNGSIKDCYAFTSWCNEKSQFPPQFDAPKLEILLLNDIGDERELSEANFAGMGLLKVLQIHCPYKGLVGSRLLSLPHSMNLLTNLRTLILRNYQLGDDLSWVLGLKRLEVLDLKDSRFEDLPQGLEELSKLKLLDLDYIGEQSFKIIKRCTQLQEFYVQKIRTTLRPGKCLLKDAGFPRLKRYKLQIINKYSVSTFSGDHQHLMHFHSKALSLQELKISALSPFIKDLLQQAEFVCLYRCDVGCKNIVPDFVQVAGGMNELTTSCLQFCSDLECLVDATSHEIETWLFPKVINLRLESLANLKVIWCGPPQLCFFEKLQELHISHCPKLTSLFPKCVVRAILLLQKLNINGCSELKNIIEEDGDGANSEIISASNNSASLVFSKLKSLTIIDCDKLEYVFSNSCVQGLEQLEEVCISGASQLKYAFGQHEDEHQEVQIKLPALKSLELNGLKNLLSIFPKTIHSSCPRLREMQCVKCPKFKDSFVNITVGSTINMDNQLNSGISAPLSFLNLEKLKVDDCSTEDILFRLEEDVLTKRTSQSKLTSSLNALKLKNLPDLKFVWSGPMEKLSLRNLREFRVSGCNNLKTIFSPVILKRMPPLKCLEISDCDELEEIASSAEVGEQHQSPLNSPHSPQICFPNLKRLRVQRCNKLKCLFSMAIDWSDFSENVLPNLRSLILGEVPSLKDLCHNLSFSNDCLRQLLCSKLEVLELESLPELWLIWGAPSHISNLIHLRTLDLYNCKKLKSVFGEGSPERSLPMLETLMIQSCEELEVILTQQDHQSFQTSFPKLKELMVYQCNKLKSLFSTSSVTILPPHLYYIDISECAELEQLFERRSEPNSSSDNVNKIVLPNFTNILLKELPSLVDICKGFKLSVENGGILEMKNCPKFSSVMGATGSMWISIFTQKVEPHANNGNQPFHQLPYFYPTALKLSLPPKI